MVPVLSRQHGLRWYLLRTRPLTRTNALSRRNELAIDSTWTCDNTQLNIEYCLTFDWGITLRRELGWCISPCY